jgi:phosphate transport system ATP-binding protein
MNSGIHVMNDVKDRGLEMTLDRVGETANSDNGIRMRVEDLSVYYGKVQAVKNVTMSIRTQKVTALIGPSGCGKSTFIRCLNRMHELTPGARVEGNVLLDEQNLYGSPEA